MIRIYRSLLHVSLQSLKDQGPVFRKPRKLFGPVKPFLVHLYLKTEKCIRLIETSCMKRTSVTIYIAESEKNELYKYVGYLLTVACDTVMIKLLGFTRKKYTGRQFYEFSIFYRLAGRFSP